MRYSSEAPIQLLAGEEFIEEPSLHWSWIVPTLIKALGILAVFLGLVYLFSEFFWARPAGRIISALVLAGVIIYIQTVRKIHHLSKFYITNYRLIYVERERILHAETIEIPYDHIQNIRCLVRGFWGTLLKYGTLEIHTAGEEGVVYVGNGHLADTLSVQALILKVRDEFLNKVGVARNKLPQMEGALQPEYGNPILPLLKGIASAYSPQTKEAAPIAGFAPSDQDAIGTHAIGGDQKNRRDFSALEDESLMVGMLASRDEFKKNVIKGLVDDLRGSPTKGRRLVKAVTSNAYFKEEVINSIQNDLLNKE